MSDNQQSGVKDSSRNKKEKKQSNGKDTQEYINSLSAFPPASSSGPLRDRNTEVSASVSFDPSAMADLSTIVAIVHSREPSRRLYKKQSLSICITSDRADRAAALPNGSPGRPGRILGFGLSDWYMGPTLPKSLETLRDIHLDHLSSIICSVYIHIAHKPLVHSQLQCLPSLTLLVGPFAVPRPPARADLRLCSSSLVDETGYAVTDPKKYLNFELKKYELEPLKDDRITVAVEVCGVCGSVSTAKSTRRKWSGPAEHFAL